MGVLRVILALVVVVGHNFHAHADIGTGVIVAVKAFFVISGFYMALILNERYNGVPLAVFWKNRLLRLMPIYYVVLALTLVAVLLAGPTLGVLLDLRPWQRLLELPGHLWLKAYLFFTNLTALGIETTIYTCADSATGTLNLFRNGCAGDILNRFVLIPQAWSISVELFFYALVPFLVRASNRQLAGLIGVAVLSRVALSVAGWDDNPWNRSVAPLELIYFLLGIAAYRFYARTRNRQPSRRGLAGATLALWSLTVGFVPLSTALGLSPMVENWLWWVYFGVLALALPFVFRFTMHSRWDSAIGELSYPIYVCHVLVLQLFDRYGGPAPHTAVGGRLAWQLLNIGAVLLVSQALVTFVGLPIDRYRHARTMRAKTNADSFGPTPSAAGVA